MKLESYLNFFDDLNICLRLIIPGFFSVLCWKLNCEIGLEEGGIWCYDEIEKGEMGWLVGWGGGGVIEVLNSCEVLFELSCFWSCLSILFDSSTIVITMFFFAALTKNLSMKDDDETEMIIALTSDRGLCGSIHSSVVKAIKARLVEKDDAKLVLVGDKAKAMLQK